MSKLHFPHPGEILRTEFLDELNLSQYRLAVDIGIPHSRVTAIIKGQRAVTPDTALRLARSQLWLARRLILADSLNNYIEVICFLWIMTRFALY